MKTEGQGCPFSHPLDVVGKLVDRAAQAFLEEVDELGMGVAQAATFKTGMDAEKDAKELLLVNN